MTLSVLQVVCLSIVFLVTLAGVFAFIRGVMRVWALIREGAKQPGRATHPWLRLWTLIKRVFGHQEFRARPAVRVAHWLVMVSFPLLFVTLKTGYKQIVLPTYQLPLLGHFRPWLWLIEGISWLSLFGILWLIGVRKFNERQLAAGGAKRSRFYGSSRWQAHFVEFVVLVVVLCVIVLRGLEWAYYRTLPTVTPPVSEFPLTFFVGNLFLLAHPSATTLANAIIIISTVKVTVSMSWLIVVGTQVSMGIAWHRFLAVFNLYFRREPDGSKALGPVAPLLVKGEPFDLRTADQLDPSTSFGMQTVADMSWKTRLDVLSCTECGRCQEACPAWNSGKMLSPKLLVLALRDHLVSQSALAHYSEKARAKGDEDATDSSSGAASSYDATEAIVSETSRFFTPDLMPHSADVLEALRDSGITGEDGVPIVSSAIAGEVLPDQMIWDCTTCGACVQACPVGIEHLDHIVDLRRALVMTQGKVPKGLTKPFKSLQTKGNVYNQMARKRLDWAKDLTIPVPVIGVDVPDATSVDYLLWVGDAGCFDDRGKRITQAVAQLLDKAGTSFAVLGAAETSIGDLARRTGNEALFQELALQAIQTLNEAKATKIIVTDPHYYNTISREFPAFGGNFQVFHHTQVLNRLVREGKLKPVAPPSSQLRTLTYHDPCYLGRHSGEYEAPRQILQSLPGMELKEMKLSRSNSLCCGAGGGRVFQPETQGESMGKRRIAQAAEIGAQVVATGCPYCSVMLGASVSTDNPIEVKDVAILLWEAVSREQVA